MLFKYSTSDISFSLGALFTADVLTFILNKNNRPGGEMKNISILTNSSEKGHSRILRDFYGAIISV